MAKLENIKAIRQMLDGTHRTQNKTKISFTDTESAAEKSKRREVGEKWNELDADGNVIAIWEQKKGYRTKHNPNSETFQSVRDYLNSYPNCMLSEEECNSMPKNRLDKRFRNKFGRCSECQFKYETQLKFKGEYEEYERRQMLANAEAFFKNADSEIELVCKQMAGEIHFANSDGRMEVWSGDIQKANEIKEEYYKYKEIALENIRNYGKKIKDENE